MRSWTWLLDCAIVDVDEARLVPDAAVALDGDRIVWVGPASDKVVVEAASGGGSDAGPVHWLNGGVVLPGLIDAHGHLFRRSDHDPLGTYLAATDEQRWDTGVRHARQALHAGVTTVRDLGGPARLSAALADLTRTDPAAGPTLVWAGAPVTRRGGDDGYFGGEVDGPSAAVRLVEDQASAGAGVVAMIVSGGGLTPGTSPARVELDRQTMEAVVEAAGSAGLDVVARCHATAGMIACLELGVATIEHASFLDPDGTVRFDPAVAAQLRAAGVAIGPTLNAAQRALARYQRDGVANPDDRHALSRLEARSANFSAWLSAGVTLAAGSASGYLDVGAGALVDELVAYVGAGMDAAAALRTATVGNARLLGRDDLGRVAAGHQADLVVVAANPLDDLTVLRRPHRVMRHGNFVPLSTATKA